ncbi:helix-turn-helix domain-containing protein [Chitinophaga tropicalis]|uniref:Helix-turn-helix domain-containing protein n=1 Tax=Chitinophaga tropicalis TaxID=2683588 RepID=A0A7K1TX15_9BACT|nr:AraC family transcriptional regulator [Chitinophaga tropicalis]MVT06651.1 helix-turn-helix domain-containing protein [Chitinophaga tropicalis]
MYTFYDNLRFTGQDYISTWQSGNRSWAAYSVYNHKAGHEIYTPYTILNLVLRGRKRMYDGRFIHHLEAGDVLVIPPGALLCSEIMAHRDGFESINIVLPEQLINTFAGTGENLQLGAVKLDAALSWQLFAENLQQQFSEGAMPSREAIVTKALQLLAGSRQGAAVLGMLQQASADTLPVAMEAIGRELPELEKLDDIARKSCMSKATLKRRFRQLYNAAPMHWLWEKRLEKACFLLSTTSLSIHDIAYSTGFENIPHFYRLFRNAYGVTPKTWKLSFSANDDRY